MSITTDIAEKAQTAASAAQYGGGASAFYFGMTANELAAYVGATVAVLGFFANTGINWYFKRQELKLLRERMRRE